MERIILEVQNIFKDFGGLSALTDISFGVECGQIMSIIGPNGSGKTTLLNLISGVSPQTRGCIYFRGQLISGLKAHNIASLGIARTWQNIKLFGNMTVVENVMVGRHLKNKADFLSCGFNLPWIWRSEREDFEKAMEILENFGLGKFAMEQARNLSFGDQRKLEIARVLAIEPSIILLDEPAAGMNQTETKKLDEILQKMKNQHLTILLVEHVIELVAGVSDKVMVINHGKKLTEGKYEEIQNNPDVIRAYLGQGINFAKRKKR